MKTCFYYHRLVFIVFMFSCFLGNKNNFVKCSEDANSSISFWTPTMEDRNRTYEITTPGDVSNHNHSDNIIYPYNDQASSEFVEDFPKNDSAVTQSTTETKKDNNLDNPEGDEEELQDRCSPKLYSCRHRCNTAPRLACSCHVTCKVYGNCCEDFDDMCPTLVERQIEEFADFLEADVQCVANNFLIASCKDGDVPGSMASNVTIDSKLWLHGLDAEDFVIRCHQWRSDDPQYHAPVTDTKTRLHFKNVFCAVCNGVYRVQLWHGLTHCKYGEHKNTTTQSPLIISSNGEDGDVTRNILSGFDIESLLISDRCQTFWRPKIHTQETTNPCLHETDTISAPSQQRSPLMRSHNVITEVNTTVIENDLSNKFLSLHLEWRNVSGQFFSSMNQSYFQAKCQTLISFVEHPTDSSSRYKNKYCFMLDINSTVTNKFCEPNLAISDDGGVWYTVELRHGVEGHVINSTGLSEDHWVVYEGIEEFLWDDLVSDDSLSRCDGKTALIYEDKCRTKSFYLTMKTNFTFIRSSLIRGDFNAQVEKFTDLLVETFVDKISNRTACVVVSFEHGKVPGSSLKHQSSAEFQCLDILSNSGAGSQDSLTATPVSLTHGGSINDNDVNHYIAFVTNTLRIVVEKEKAVTLPVTIEIAPCIFPDKDANDKVRGYCTKVKNVWRAARKVNSLVGGLSLEGILTIICCILSVFGLIIRLALQNVVPFYKSYPGKIQFGLCLSLFLAYALFMLGGLVQEGSMTCTVLAIFTHVAFLSALFWMNVTAFEIWRTFRTWRNQVVSRGHASLILSVFYAVGIPLLIMTTALLVEEFLPHSQFSPSYGEHDCWLNGSMAVAFYFVTPCCIICCVNAIFVGLTLKSLRRQRTSISEFKKSNATTAVTDVGIVIKIILLVGITWLLGLLAALVDNEWLWILFTVINASLGFLISVVLVFNKRVYYTVRAKCLCYTSETISVVSTQVQRH